MKRILDNPWSVFSIVLGIVAVLLLKNDSLSFWDQDESSYAGFAYNMIENNDFITPQFTWGEPHRKTPFHFWAIALSYQVFGVNEFAVRFPSLMAVLMTAAVVFYLGKRIFGRDVALGGALVLISSILLPSLGKIAVTDSILLFFETLAILALFRFIKHPAFQEAGMLCIGLAGGMLVKGPPVLMLVGVAGFVLLILHPNRFRLLSYKLVLAVLVSFVPILVWGRIAWLQDGGTFIMFLLDHYIINRAKGGTFANQTGPPGYYFVIFLVSFIFWLPFFIGGLKEMFLNVWKYFTKKSTFNLVETDIILLCWCIAGWLLYEPIKSKLPAYALGAYPAIALIIARNTLSFKEGIKTKLYLVWSYVQIGLIILVAIAFSVAFYLLLGPESLITTILFGLTSIGIVIITFRALSSGKIETGFKLTFLSVFLFMFLGWGFLVPLLEPNRSITKRATQAIVALLPKNGTVVFSKTFYLPSFPFYVLKAGLRYEASEPSIDDLANKYHSDQKVAIVLDDEKWNLFKEKVPNAKILVIQGWALDMAKQTTLTIVLN